MSKEDFIQQEGIITESLPNAMFRIEVEGGEPILGHLSGKMRKHFIKVLPGDRVLFEMSPYDLTKGRIIRRLKPGEDASQYGAQTLVQPASTAGPTVEPGVTTEEQPQSEEENAS